MGDLEKGRIDRPRDEGVFTSRLESDKKDKVPFVQLPSTGSKRILVATFLNTLKRLFDSFSTEEGGSLAGKVIDKQTVIETLLAFKNLLLSLCEDDLSQNASFAQELSDHWLKIQDDFNKLQTSERKGSTKVAIFRKLIDSINHYPEGADHSFGYYLIEQAGKDWLPFPFIEILLTLHTEYKQKGENCTLSQWVRHIEEVSRELRGKIPL